MSEFEKFLIEIGIEKTKVSTLKKGFKSLLSEFNKLDQKEINIINEYYLKELIFKLCRLDGLKNPFK